MPLPAKTSPLVADERPKRGILDTSVVIDLDQLEAHALPIEVAVTALTMAELAAGPHAATDSNERARRQDRLQRTEAAFDPLPFNAEAARAYGRIYAAGPICWPEGARDPGCRLDDRRNRLLGRATALHAEPRGLRSFGRSGGNHRDLSAHPLAYLDSGSSVVVRQLVGTTFGWLRHLVGTTLAPAERGHL
jgi:hypothetical protein